MTDKSTGSQLRKPEYRISEIFLDRWSSRAMSGEALSEEALMTLFEAAKWAPSCFNSQPWRFLYATRDTEEWNLFFSFLISFNQSWAINAGALIVVLSKRTFESSGQAAPTHTFDTGAAWQNLALQASIMGLVAHAMQGFDYERAREVLAVPEDYQVEAMIAVGNPGDIEKLPEELQKRENPSSRKAISEFAFEGKFPAWA
jgi:nitroreductase